MEPFPWRIAVVALAFATTLDLLPFANAAPPQVALEAHASLAPDFLASTGENAAETATLTVNVTASSEASVNLLVTHADASGTTVDRVVPVDLSGNKQATAQLQDIRADANYSVRALLADVALPSLSNVTRLIDGNLTDDLPYIAGAAARPPPVRQVAENPLHAYAAAQSRPGNHLEHRQLITTPSGLFVVLYVEQEGEAGKGGESFTLFARTSRDGARTFSEPAVIAVKNGVSFIQFRGAPYLGGTVSVLWDWYISGEPPGRGYELVNFDAASLDVRSRLPIEQPPGFYPERAVVGLPNQTMLLPIGFDGKLNLWFLSANGTLRKGPGLAAAEWKNWPGGVVADGTATGVIGIAVSVWEPDKGFGRAWFTRSLDGGRSFSAPRILSTLEAPIAANAMGVDQAGTLHIALRVTNLSAFATQHPSVYARVAPDGTIIARSYAEILRWPPGYHSWNPLVGASAGKVWLLWYNQTGERSLWGMYAAESLDNGASFGPSYHLLIHYEGVVYTNTVPEDARISADGRPILLVSIYSTRLVVTVPLFDPLADVASGLVRIENAMARSGFLVAPPESFPASKASTIPSTSESGPPPGGESDSTSGAPDQGKAIPAGPGVVTTTLFLAVTVLLFRRFADP